jgi:hypothetical protein
MVLSLDSEDYTDNHRQSLALFALVAFGVGQVLGGVLPGWIIDKIGS